jgi:hypothetical protein
VTTCGVSGVTVRSVRRVSRLEHGQGEKHGKPKQNMHLTAPANFSTGQQYVLALAGVEVTKGVG